MTIIKNFLGLKEEIREKPPIPSNISVLKMYGYVLDKDSRIEDYDGDTLVVSYPLETSRSFLNYINMTDYFVDNKHTGRLFVDFKKLPFKIGSVYKSSRSNKQLVVTNYKGGNKVAVRFGKKQGVTFLTGTKVYLMSIDSLTKFWH